MAIVDNFTLECLIKIQEIQWISSGVLCQAQVQIYRRLLMAISIGPVAWA